MFASCLRNARASPPARGSLSAHPPSRQLSALPRSARWLRRAAYVVGGSGALWFVDRQYNASAMARTLRTFSTCAMIALDYKLNFTPEMAEGIPSLHERVSERMYDLFTSNGGLYIKIGQAFANNAALMPKPMQEKFSRLFDDAPQIPFSVVKSVFEREFGKPLTGPDGIFGEFEERAAASASIAQVHRARLKTADGSEQWVAVKVQKPDVSKQVEWDLGAFRIVMWIYENYLFDMPVYFTVDFINEHLRRELDFELEANNALSTAAFIAKEPRLAQKVYIPKVYPELSTKKVMVAEWIDGVRLSDRRGIRRLMGEEDYDTPAAPSSRPTALTGGVKSVMTTMVELFSAQIFDWGWVHCDPHPGNIIIRPHPENPTAPQFVLLDHGLYVRLTKDFQRQYATLWKGLMTLDLGVVKGVAEQWGIGAPDLFASATLMRPVRFADQDKDAQNFEDLDEYQRSVLIKEKLKSFLSDTDKIPKPLIFIGRNMRIVQGNNQSFGSPVNRIRITGYWASRSLTEAPNLTLSERLHEHQRYTIFRLVLLTIDLAFLWSQFKQWLRARMGLRGEGFEDELERTMRGFAKSNFGIDMPEQAFEG
ncbi:ABC1-domain-containing protein [Wolfiporia cocos MD-104 SS10]|uniref:ABC1-domain-containing protein n=1 Tax=Wolfiporia cocos (strain MD-104) TaxID=742152 RepID=A0A2H3JDD0_WOLCO|nr:ABC1-domain-containing protein [Wolfiporia cocos MD-104 SS10]